MKKNYFIVLMTILLICFTGCATTNTISTSSAKKALKKGDWGTPTTHTLLYGLAENNVQLSSTLLQQNPNIGYKFLKPYKLTSTSYILGLIPVGEDRFFIYPLPVGSELKEFSYLTTVVTSNYTYTNTTYRGIAGVDIALTKPGLQFYGTENKGHREELTTLKKMLKYFKGSDWETVIQTRIKEISNDK